jgi:hypothetical protein
MSRTGRKARVVSSSLRNEEKRAKQKKRNRSKISKKARVVPSSLRTPSTETYMIETDEEV